MQPLSADDIRASFVNASKGEASRIPLPGLHEVIWEEREYLGWRDQQSPLRGYVVHWIDDRPRGIMLRASEASLRPGISAMCTWCRITRRSDEISLFSAARAGQAGRNGNTVGTYACADLACSHLIRVLPPANDMQDPQQLLASRIEGVTARLQAFTADIMKTA